LGILFFVKPLIVSENFGKVSAAALFVMKMIASVTLTDQR
jgi:hypothetical protein